MSISILGVALLVASVSRVLPVSMIAFFFGGLAMILAISSVNTMLQTIADEDKRGRVMSFYAMALMGTTPIGSLLAGSVASGIGIPITLIIAGSVTLVTALLFGLKIKSLRKYIRPIYVTKGILPGLQNDLN
jgi:MFS family permease